MRLFLRRNKNPPQRDYFTLFGLLVCSAFAMSESKVTEIDLRSDTVTKPTDEMRKAMAAAVVGDDVFGKPTAASILGTRDALLGLIAGRQILRCTTSFVSRRRSDSERAGEGRRQDAGQGGSAVRAERLDGELDLPHGALPRARQRDDCWRQVPHLPGRAVCWDLLVQPTCVCVSLQFEGGGAAMLAGVPTRVVANQKDGTLDLKEVEAAIRPVDDHQPTTRLVCIENTHNKSATRIELRVCERYVQFRNAGAVAVC